MSAERGEPAGGPLEALPRDARTPGARTRQRLDRDRRARRRRGRDDVLDLRPAESLDSLLGAAGGRRLRPPHRGLLQRPGGDRRAGTADRDRRREGRQSRLGRTRRRPRGDRDGRRAPVPEADPPRRDASTAAQNQPQRHDRRDRHRQGAGPRRGRAQLPALARPSPTSSWKRCSRRSTPTRSSTCSCWSPAGRRASAAAAASSPGPSAACSPSPTTSPTSTGCWRSGAARSPVRSTTSAC